VVRRAQAAGEARLPGRAHGARPPLPRTQNESIVRLLAADLVDPAAVLEGLEGMRAEIEAALAQVSAARAQWTELPHRMNLLEVNGRYATRLLELQREWLDEARRALAP
jgi:hypothetical protein